MTLRHKQFGRFDMYQGITSKLGRGMKTWLQDEAGNSFTAPLSLAALRELLIAQPQARLVAGSTDLALTPQSLSPGEGTPIPTTWHQPLEQHAIALKSGMDHPAIDPYLKWIRSDRVSKQIQPAGYDACP